MNDERPLRKVLANALSQVAPVGDSLAAGLYQEVIDSILAKPEVRAALRAEATRDEGRLDEKRLAAALRVMLHVDPDDDRRSDFGELIVPLSRVSEAAKYIATEYRDSRAASSPEPVPSEPGPEYERCSDCRHVAFAVHFVADPTNHHNAAKCPYCRGNAPEPVPSEPECVHCGLPKGDPSGCPRFCTKQGHPFDDHTGPTVDPVPVGAYVASALMAAHYGGDSGEDVDRFLNELEARGYAVVPLRVALAAEAADDQRRAEPVPSEDPIEQQRLYGDLVGAHDDVAKRLSRVPCARYWGSDGTLCSTHHGRFASDTDMECSRV